MRYDDVKDALYPDTADARGLQLRAGRAAAAVGPRRVGQPTFQRHGGHRGVLRPGPAALPRPGRPALVRRRQPALGPVGRRARHELPDQQRRPGRGVRGLRRDPALAHPGVPRASSATVRRPASRRAWSSSPPTPRPPDQRAQVRSSTPSRGLPRTAAPQGPARMMFAPRPGRHLGRRSPSSSTPTPPSARSTRSRSPCRSPSSTTTTCRSSPTSPRGSARRSAGCRVPPRENHGKYLLRGRDLSRRALRCLCRGWRSSCRQLWPGK